MFCPTGDPLDSKRALDHELRRTIPLASHLGHQSRPFERCKWILHSSYQATLPSRLKASVRRFLSCFEYVLPGSGHPLRVVPPHTDVCSRAHTLAHEEPSECSSSLPRGPSKRFFHR